MTRVARTVAFVLVAAAHAALASAQTIPSTFQDLQYLVRPGDRVMVVDMEGSKTTGRIAELDESALSIKSGDGERRFRQEQVLVIRHRQPDSIRNGVALGAAIGAGLGVVTELSCGGNDDYCGKPGWVTLGATMWGMGIGMFADLLHETPRDVFRRGSDRTSRSLTVAPLIGRGAAGGQVALRW